LGRSAQVVGELLWEASHSEGVTGRSPLQTSRAQRAFLGTAVYKVSRWLTLGVSNFLSWSQSTWCRQQLYDSSTTQNVQFWHLPGECNSRREGIQVWSGSACLAQLTALVQRQGKCRVVPIHCTPANYSCSASSNTMLAGSGITMCERQGLHHHTVKGGSWHITASLYVWHPSSFSACTPQAF